MMHLLFCLSAGEANVTTQTILSTTSRNMIPAEDTIAADD